MSATALLRARGLTKHFPVRAGGPFSRRLALHAVDGVDLEIAAGEAVGLVGESGCGKSTLARLVARLLDPNAGELWWGGRPIGAIPPAAFARSALRREIQMVFQDPTESLNPRFTAFELIADPVRCLMPGDASTRRGRVEAAADAVHLPRDLLDRRPHQLSAGQKARIGLARAIAVEPRLLVLDEPTAALDVSVQAGVLHLLDGLRRDRGLALLFVSHDLDVVRLLCDRVLVMYGGQVVESGPAAALCRHPLHPYTRALLSAVPKLGAARAGRTGLDGDPPSPVAPASDRCRFAGRCSAEEARCSRAMPPLRPVGEDRRLRCVLDGR